jgi:gustatory receptor
MSVFEQLNPFVSLCQACGLIPYTIEYNLITNKFSRYTFSIKHRTTWWFVGILALQFASICFTSYSARKLDHHISTDKSLPVTANILSLVNSISSFVQLLLSRWIVMRYRLLQTAIKAVQEVERLLGEEFMTQHKSSLTTRFVIGFILILTTVSP